jgi:hypothetical protein
MSFLALLWTKYIRDVSLHQHSGPYLLSSDKDHGIGLFWCEED